jgi:DNA-nicking Smr family endonuclease
MSSEGTDKRRPRRRLSEDEHRLWSGITRSVVPLKRKPSGPHQYAAVQSRGERAPPPPARRRADSMPTRPAAPKSVVKSAIKPALSFAPLDRRQKQRLARGTEPIDGRIDLHGKSQSEAHAALLAFLRRAQADGARFVLVITGKGGASGSSGERGILKRQVPLWLRQPEFRLHVLAVEDAHGVHGGEGALYVRVRRARN